MNGTAMAVVGVVAVAAAAVAVVWYVKQQNATAAASGGVGAPAVMAPAVVQAGAALLPTPARPPDVAADWKPASVQQIAGFFGGGLAKSILGADMNEAAKLAAARQASAPSTSSSSPLDGLAKAGKAVNDVVKTVSAIGKGVNDIFKSFGF